MKKIFGLALVLSLVTPYFSGVAMAAPQASSDEVMKKEIEEQVTLAVMDYSQGVEKKDGSLYYTLAMRELKTGAYKTDGGDRTRTWLWVAVAAVTAFLLSSISKNVSDSKVRDCIDRCVRIDDMPYEACKSDCRYDSGSH